MMAARTARPLILGLILIAVSLGAAPASDEPTTLARAGAIGCGNNLKSFAHFKCKFKRTQGTASSIDDIRAGKYSVRMSCEYSILVDGDNFHATRLGQKWSEVRNKPKAIPIGGGLARTEINYCQLETYLTNGTMDFSFNHAGTVNIYKPDLPRPPGDYHPLSMGMFGPYLRNTPDALAAKPDQYKLAGGVLKQVNERPTIGCQITGQSSGFVLTWDFAFDPARGYLPVRMSRSGERTSKGDQGVPDTEVWLFEARDCGKGRYFPTRFVIFAYPRARGQPFILTEVQVVDLDPDFKPTREDMTVVVPGGTEVIYFRSKESPMTVLKQDEAIHPQDLPGLFEIIEATQQNPLADTAVPRSESRKWWILAAGAGVVVVAILIGLRLFARRRIAPGAGP